MIGSVEISTLLLMSFGLAAIAVTSVSLAVYFSRFKKIPLTTNKIAAPPIRPTSPEDFVKEANAYMDELSNI